MLGQHKLCYTKWRVSLPIRWQTQVVSHCHFALHTHPTLHWSTANTFHHRARKADR